MGWFLVILAVLVVIAFSGGETDSSLSSGANITTNSVVYPHDVLCEKCNHRVKPNMNTIQIENWDLKCDKCGHIAYEHPKRQDRIDQLDYLLDQTS